MIRQMFDAVKSMFTPRKVHTRPTPPAPPRAMPHNLLAAAMLTEPRRRKSPRVKAGAGRMFRSYKPAKEV